MGAGVLACPDGVVPQSSVMGGARGRRSTPTPTPPVSRRFRRAPPLRQPASPTSPQQREGRPAQDRRGARPRPAVGAARGWRRAEVARTPPPDVADLDLAAHMHTESTSHAQAPGYIVRRLPGMLRRTEPCTPRWRCSTHDMLCGICRRAGIAKDALTAICHDACRNSCRNACMHAFRPLVRLSVRLFMHRSAHSSVFTYT